MKKAALYVRVSRPDQNPQMQLLDLRPLVAARGFEIVAEYNDTISGSKAKRPGLERRLLRCFSEQQNGGVMCPQLYRRHPSRHRRASR